ncbi:hypothetical protein A2U01_0035936, partial [Trifolium medium]|nr:hypothetical protein [Trifolium medium]
YLDAWENLRKDISKDLDKIQYGDANELLTFQENTKEWVEEVNKRVEVAQLKKKGRLSISENFFDETTMTNQLWRENLGLLDSDLNMHLKFSMDSGPMFVKKKFVENSEFEAFKAEVNEQLRVMTAKQDDMSADLKAILDILRPK